MMTYRAYGRVIASDRPLPELEEESTTRTPHLTVTWNARLPFAADAQWSTLWRFSTGEPWVTTSRLNGARCLRFGRFADCVLSERRIDVVGRGHASDATLRHLVLDQALPLALAAGGALVVHASAVAAGSRAILLAGNAGTGKSTLAALLSREGLQVLADDGVVLERRAPDIRVVPSYPGLRVYRDSAAAAGLDIGGSNDVAEYTRKLLVMGSRVSSPSADQSPMLAAIYVLSRGENTVTFEKLSRRDATMEVLAHAYRIDPGDRAALRAQLDCVAAMTPPVWRVSYPRDLARAAGVASSIAAHAAAIA